VENNQILDKSATVSSDITVSAATDDQNRDANIELNPLDFGCDVAEINRIIRERRHGEDTRPREQYTKDTLETYQNFAKEHLGFEFNDVKLFITALTHRSYINEHRNVNVEHNERLEFLGDAILELVVSDFLYRNFKEPEGIMTAWRASLVRTESIGEASEEIGYADLIRLSKGERKAMENGHKKLVADCFEATTGAIYLDQGYAAAKKHIYKYIIPRTYDIIVGGTWRDPKSYVQELAQKIEGPTPQYRLVSEEGPDHDRHFVIELLVGKEVRGLGEGDSKQAAETNAARQAIEYYNSLNVDVRAGKLSPDNL